MSVAIILKYRNEIVQPRSRLIIFPGELPRLMGPWGVICSGLSMFPPGTSVETGAEGFGNFTIVFARVIVQCISCSKFSSFQSNLLAWHDDVLCVLPLHDMILEFPFLLCAHLSLFVGLFV